MFKIRKIVISYPSKRFLFFFLLSFFCYGFEIIKPNQPVIYLIGDSTVDDGSGSKGLWGWGKFFPQFFNSSKISVKNYAQGGTSARTFQTNGIWDNKINKLGMWDTVSTKLKKGDFLVIQFGLNDQGPVADSLRARGTLKGIGEDSIQIYNQVTKMPETVHSFGWYIRKYIREAKAKGVTVIICSSVPKNNWSEGKLIRGENGFANSALQVAEEEKVFAIDLNNMIADVYDREGEKIVTENYHIEIDKTHTTEPGALLNASMVINGINQLKKLKLKNYLLQQYQK